MKGAKRFGFLACTLWCAEIAGSWWIWTDAPTDTIRVQYHRFWDFELERLHGWTSIFGFLIAGWVVIHCLRRHQVSSKDLSEKYRRQRLIVLWIATITSGLLLEVLSSVVYWKNPSSVHIHYLYESAWYWGRVPTSRDLGWPSFRGYLCDHFIPWLVVLFCAVTLWHRFEK
jgi:hypothetical protein